VSRGAQQAANRNSTGLGGRYRTGLDWYLALPIAPFIGSGGNDCGNVTQGCDIRLSTGLKCGADQGEPALWHYALDLILRYKARESLRVSRLLKMNVTDDWLSGIVTCLLNGTENK
jgi:hypothetical protein